MSHATVFLVRHGAHDLLGHRVAGRMPGVSLNADGRAQASRAAARLARERITTLVTSPLERARETMAPIETALGRSATVDEDVTELDFGAWTGAKLSSLSGDHTWHRWNRERAASRIPDGESMDEVRSRASAAIERWRTSHPSGAVVATSHGDVIKAVVCGVIGLSFDRIHDFDVDPGSITSLVVWEGGAKLLTLNEIPA